MLTGRAAELRPWINYLAVHPIVLVTPEQARFDALAGPRPIESAETLRTRGRQANLRRARTNAQTNAGRSIPIGGGARRRAKAIRNREAVATIGWRDLPSSALPFTITRGKQYEGDFIHRDEMAAELHTFKARGFLAGILNWCNGQPATGPLPDSGPIEMRREADGTITVVGEAPRFLSISADLLSLASQDYLSFADGVLTMDVDPEPLHYRPLGPDPASYAVIFERIWEV